MRGGRGFDYQVLPPSPIFSLIIAPPTFINKLTAPITANVPEEGEGEGGIRSAATNKQLLVLQTRGDDYAPRGITSPRLPSASSRK